MPFSRGSPHPGIKPVSLISPAPAGEFFTISATWEVPWPLAEAKVGCSYEPGPSVPLGRGSGTCISASPQAPKGSSSQHRAGEAGGPEDQPSPLGAWGATKEQTPLPRHGD